MATSKMILFLLIASFLAITEGDYSAQLIADIAPGVGDSDPAAFAAIDGQLYFAAGAGPSAQAWVWRNTSAVVEAIPFIDAAPIKFLKYMDQVLIFTRDGLFAQNSDNTVEQLSTGYIVADNFIEYNGRVYFSQGLELWATDGTKEGTVLVIEIGQGHSAHPDFFTVFNDKLFFAAFPTGLDSTEELWCTDGTTQGTQLLDFESVDLVLNINPPIVVNGKLLVVGETLGTGRELWAIDTNLNVELVADLSPGSETTHFGTFGRLTDTLVAFLDGGTELWITDGTATNTRLIYEFPEYVHGSKYFTKFKNKLFIVGDSDLYGTAVYYTDGTEDGTGQLIDTGEASNPRHLVVSGDTLYFIADSTAGETMLYECDGSVEGTGPMDIAWPNDVSPLNTVETDPYQNFLMGDQAIFAYDGHLVFAASNGTSGREPWWIEREPTLSQIDLIRQLLLLIISLLEHLIALGFS